MNAREFAAVDVWTATDTRSDRGPFTVYRRRGGWSVSYSGITYTRNGLAAGDKFVLPTRDAAQGWADVQADQLAAMSRLEIRRTLVECPDCQGSKTTMCDDVENDRVVWSVCERCEGAGTVAP